MAGVAEIISKAALGETRTRSRLHSDHARIAFALDLAADIRHYEAGKIRAASGAADDDVWLFAGESHLLDRFLANDRLMQQHVIEHAAQRVLGVWIFRSHFNGFRDGNAK